MFRAVVVFTPGHLGYHKKRAAPVCMILVIFLEARPRAGAIKATKATQATDLMVFPAPGPAGSGRAQTPPRWLLPDTDRRIPHELQGPILHFRTLPSATASSRGVGEPGTGAKVVKDRTGPDLDERVG